jgi:hypothetical protein
MRVMGIVVSIAIAFMAVVIIGVPYLNWEPWLVRDALEKAEHDFQIAISKGTPMRVASLLPAVKLQGADIVVTKQHDGVTHRLGEAKSVTVTLSYRDLLNLMRRQGLRVADITVVEPGITVEHAADGSLILPALPDRLKPAAVASSQGGPVGNGLRVDRFRLTKGSVVYRPYANATPISATLHVEGGLTDWQGSGTIGGKSVLTIGSGAGLTLTVDSLTWRNDGKKFALNGAIRSQSTTLKIDADAAMPLSSATASATVSAKADVAARLFDELSSFAGWQDLSGLIQHDLPLDGSATLRVSPDLITADPVKLKIGSDSASLIVAYAGSGNPTLEAKIDVETLDLGNWRIGQGQPRSCSPAPASAAPARAGIRVDEWAIDVRSTIKTLTYKAAKVTTPATTSNVEANLRMRNGVMALPRFSALLPGGMTVEASTAMTAQNDGKSTTGKFSIKGTRLNETLVAFGIAAPDSREDTLSSLDINGGITIAPDRAQLTDLRIGVDDLQGRGSLSLSLAEPKVAVVALDFDTPNLDRFLPDASTLSEVRASKVYLDTEVAWPSAGGLDCFRIRKVAIEAGTLEATRRQTPEAAASESTAFGRSILEAGAAVGDFSNDVRRQLAIGGSDGGSPIGAAIFDGLEKDLPNLTRVLERVDSPDPVRLVAKRVILRDAPAKIPGKGAATVDAADVRASINVADVPGQSDQTKRAVFELSTSAAALGDLHLRTLVAVTSIDFTVANGVAKLVEGRVQRFSVAGDAPDYARPRGTAGSIQRQPFAVSGHLALTRSEVSGTIETLDIGDLLYAEHVALRIERVGNQPINVAIWTPDATKKLALNRSKEWPLERPDLQHASCSVQLPPAGRQFAKFNVLILGQAPQPPGLAGQVASVDRVAAVAPTTRSEPLIRALSLEGTMGDAGTIIDDLSVLFGQRSSLSLRLAADGDYDTFGSQTFDISGCATTMLEGATRLPSFGGLLADKVASTLPDGTPWSSARLDVAAEKVNFTSAAGSMGSLSIKYQTVAGPGTTASTATLHLPLEFKAQKVKVSTDRKPAGAEITTASIGAVGAAIGSARLALSAPSGVPLVTLQHQERTIAGCGKGNVIDGTFDLLAIRPADVLVGVEFKKRLVPLMSQSATDARPCLAWSLVGKVGTVETLRAIAAAATKGVMVLGSESGSDGRLSELHLDVSGDHKGGLRYELRSDLVAHAASTPLSCKPRPERPASLGIHPIEAGNKDNHLSLRGSTSDADMTLWDGDVEAKARCIDLRHLWAIYEAAADEAPTIKLTAGTIERLSFSRKAGNLKALIGHLDIDLSIAANLPQGLLKAVAKYLLHMEDTIRTGLPLTVRLSSNGGRLSGQVSSLDKQLGNPKMSDVAKLPHLLRLVPQAGATTSKPIQANVYLQSPKWQTHSLGACSAYRFLPTYRQSFDVCWGCQSDRWWKIKVGDFVFFNHDPRGRCPNGQP